MAVESKFYEVDLGDGVEAVETPSMDEAGRSNTIHGSNPSRDPERKPSQNTLHTSSSRTISQSTLSMVDSLKKARPELAPPAYHDVEAQPRQSEGTATLSEQETATSRQERRERQDRAAGRGFLSWLTRKRPPPSYPSERTVSPEYNAGIFSRLTFQWMSPLMSVGFRRPLKINDIWLINPDRSVDVHVDLVNAAFKAGVEAGYKAPLFWALYSTFKAEFLLGGLCRFMSDLFVVGSPYTLRYLIQFAIDSYIAKLEGAIPPAISHGYGLVVGIIFMQIVQSFCTNHFFYNGQMVGGQTRAVLITAIFDKSMKISGRAKNGIKPPPFSATQETLVGDDECPEEEKAEQRQGSSQEKKQKKKKQKGAAAATEPGWSNGRVIGLMAIDAARIDAAAGLIHTVWTAPIIIIIALALLIVNLSYSALSGLACLIVVMAFLIKTVGGLYAKRKAINQITDKRVGLTQEVLSAIRLVKYFGWEGSFVERIIGIRTKETSALQLFMAFRNIVTAASQTLPIFAAMLSFVTYATTHSGLSPAVVFSSVALFNSLRMPLTYLPVCIGQAVDAWASLRRIQEYLLEEEQEVYEVDPELNTAILVDQASFTWEKTASGNSLRKGPAGMAGANKTTDGDVLDEKFISTTTIASEDEPFSINNVSLDIKRGELVAIIGGVGSGKTSILSALTGDMRKTQGSVTWGGSKAVCSQYAWIQNATVKQNIVFGCDLDEEWYRIVVNACSLTSDFETLPNGDATEIGERGINLSGGQKQRISLARAVYSKSEIFLLDDPLSAVDPYVGKHIFETAICGLLGNKTRVLATHQMHILNQCDRIIWMDNGRIQAIDSYHNLMLTNKAFATMVYEKVAAAQHNSEATADSAIPTAAASSVQAETAAKAAKAAKAAAGKMKDLMSAEDQNTKSIPWSVYTSYITSSDSMVLVALIIPLLCLAQGLNILSSLWLSWWSEDKYNLPQNTYIGIYVMLCVTQAIFLYLFGVCLAISCTSSSNYMLNKAMRKILHAPIAFFDTTPLGRITNRFSKDVDVMDYSLTEALRLYCISIAMVLSIFALILSYFYWFVCALVPVIIIFFFSAAYYRASAREVKRHEAVLRSVVFARFAEGLSGVSCIRSYDSQGRFVKTIKGAVDNMNSANFLTFSNQRWLNMRLDLVGVILILTVGIVVVEERFTQSPAISGLVLSYILGATQVLQFIVRQFADVENAMNATERLHTYGKDIPEEGASVNNGIIPRPPTTAWPYIGQISFENVHMRYRPELPEVLKGFNLQVAGGERIGIIGRTGAGKSSLIGALFRMQELCAGSITIDGEDISKLPLNSLRSRLSIIPQDTTLFRGTVRSNLDPFNTCSEWQLLHALQQAGLGSLHLDDKVEEEGLNFSLGQRQLIALARVLVRGSRIVVCDEATSNVDLDTDEKIQRTMLEAFKGKTVLTIAHRIRTIINYDRICVMQQGQIIELGTPRELWELGGIFKGMCERSGIGECDVADTWF
ncbi:Oligomycin resistance ATP-dependent permease YOR1 [Cytospora mali]|uniref:Oligomycin resistance ATP-dependent permease YOR1 n=1 Tax=Cytospora mali TaxID=578113 RepID=A0A194VAV2_CYTMA|nr:Oligomycin resistance ATP-dependent permease YOR1 [Valsa mali var. pyri (nom. inval.)]